MLVRSDSAETLRVKVDRPYAGSQGTLDVEPDAILDVDGAFCPRPRGLEGRCEDAGIGLLGADQGGIDDGGDGHAGAWPDLADAHLPQVAGLLGQ